MKRKPKLPVAHPPKMSVRQNWPASSLYLAPHTTDPRLLCTFWALCCAPPIMTINSTWVEIMKSESPEAFTPDAPFSPKVAYLDGMPLLMASNSTRRWEDLVRWNFGKPVQRFFSMGTKVVVLAFDDYEHVPPSKAITQANRSKKAATFEFNEREALETVPLTRRCPPAAPPPAPLYTSASPLFCIAHCTTNPLRTSRCMSLWYFGAFGGSMRFTYVRKSMLRSTQTRREM